MSQIDVRNLTFGYDGSEDTIFNDVSFQIDTNWKLGFVARNSRGKTTLLRLLMGEFSYYGKITKSVECSYFPYSIKNYDNNTIDVVEEVYPEYIFWELCRELSLLQVNEDVLYRPFSTLSHGERTKVLLAALFLNENQYLLIDEPTNHLDMEARKILGEYLRSKKGFLLVSHDRELLDDTTDHIISINRQGEVEIQKGNFSAWQQNKAFEEQFAIAENEKLSKSIKGLSQAAKRTTDWSDKIEKSKIGTHCADRGFVGHKAAKMMKRAKAVESRMEKAIEDKVGLFNNVEKNDTIQLRPIPFHKERFLEIADFSLLYGDKTVCSIPRFSLYQGQRVAVMGRNGSGKSSLLKKIRGEGIQARGTFSLASGLIISYVSQDTSFLSGNLSDFAAHEGIDETRLKTILRKFGFLRIHFDKDCSDFSSGQKKKVLLAASLCQEAHLYLWDEPLNFIDVLSRIQIENVILEHKPTMLFVEHDRTFISAIATDKLELQKIKD